MTADERRSQITRAAAELFEKRGYHRTGMDDIADAVGIRKPTLYHYVRSKAEIVAWIHEDVMTPVMRNLEARVDAGIDPREGIRRVMADILEIMEIKPGHLRVYFENYRDLPDELQADAARQRDRYESLVATLVARGVEQGIFRPTTSRLTVLALFGMVNWSYQWYRPGGGLSHTQVAEQLADIFLGGIETPHALGRSSPA